VTWDGYLDVDDGRVITETLCLPDLSNASSVLEPRFPDAPTRVMFFSKSAMLTVFKLGDLSDPIYVVFGKSLYLGLFRLSPRMAVAYYLLCLHQLHED
jgi:hypothetical protein